MAAQAAVDAIFRAAREGDAVDVARRLALEPDLLESMTTLNGGSVSLVYQAAFNGHADVVRVLIGKGADFNSKTRYGMTPIDAAVWRGHEEVVDLLLGAGAELTQTGYTTLLRACGVRHWSMTRRLIKHMSREGLNARRPYDGCTALLLACYCGQAEVTRALLLAGAHDTIASDRGTTPRHEAQRPGFHPCKTVFQVRPWTLSKTQGRRGVLILDLIMVILSAFCVWQWWDGEPERAYALHLARRVHEDTASQQQPPTDPVPAYMRQRVERGEQLPLVQLQAGNERRTTRALAKRYRGHSEEELSEEEKGAMLKYAMQDLAQELYIELMAGFHK
jgi:hypothetical protein